MKKLFFFLFSILIVSCSTGDDKDSLPYIDTSKFIKESSIVFPEKTNSLEIFSTLNEYYGNNQGEYYINGTYKHKETAVLNGQLYENTLTKNIIKIKIYKSTTPASNLFCTDFYFDDDMILKFCYQWQYHNTNVWNNDILDGEIILTNS